MKNIYLYGASDDCHEVESDFGDYESYGRIKINDIVAKYHYDGDWGIELIGDIPTTWKVKTVSANAPPKYRWRDDAGQFIHIQVPDDEIIVFSE